MAPRLDDHLDARQVGRRLGDQPRGLLVDVTRDPREIERRARVAIDRGVDVGRRQMQQGGQSLDDHRALM